MFNISVVIPVRDEEKNIPELIDRLTSTSNAMGKTFEIIFVTDINKDNTLNLLVDYSTKYKNIKTIKLSNSFGQHIAVMAGLDHCTGEYIAIMDGDLQDYPEDISILYNKIIEGFDIVYAIKENKNANFLRDISSRLFNTIMSYMADIKINSNTSMLRIISRKALEEITKFREHEPSLTYIFSFISLPTATIKARSGVRQKGQTKYNLFKLVNFAISSLISFSRKPLRMISSLGLIMSVLSFTYLAIVLYQHYLLKIKVLGWTTLMVTMTLLGGIQLLSMGVIGEYVGRMYMQTKNRPLYIVERKYGDF
ncbi:MAG: glycosyltransferase family 2 protein [Candidatus Omnitrophica bacterium]|nr:glycosyltransferase family 2 protein [Candidatus Omnitrophota bacterium]